MKLEFHISADYVRCIMELRPGHVAYTQRVFSPSNASFYKYDFICEMHLNIYIYLYTPSMAINIYTWKLQKCCAFPNGFFQFFPALFFGFPWHFRGIA